MKKFIIHLMLAVTAVCSAAPFSTAQEPRGKFGLFLSGGMGATRGGDLPRLMDGLNSKLSDVGAAAGMTITETLQHRLWGAEMEAGIIFQATRRFGLGLSVGVLRSSDDTAAAAVFEDLALVGVDWKTTTKVIPLKLSAYYHLPVGGPASAFARAGIGYYIGQMSYTARFGQTVMGVSDWEQNQGDADAGAVGFDVGLGLEIRISPGFFVFIEGAGRYVNLAQWTAAANVHSWAGRSEIQSGRFWYIEQRDPGTGRYYAAFDLSPAMPVDPDSRNVRAASFGYSGFTVKAGVRIGL